MGAAGSNQRLLACEVRPGRFRLGRVSHPWFQDFAQVAVAQ
jgi:hypothetical protein